MRYLGPRCHALAMFGGEDAERETIAAGAWMAERVRLAKEAGGSPIVGAVVRCEPDPRWNWEGRLLARLCIDGRSVGWAGLPSGGSSWNWWLTLFAMEGSAYDERTAKIAVQRARLACLLGGARP